MKVLRSKQIDELNCADWLKLLEQAVAAAPKDVSFVFAIHDEKDAKLLSLTNLDTEGGAIPAFLLEVLRRTSEPPDIAFQAKPNSTLQ